MLKKPCTRNFLNPEGAACPLMHYLAANQVHCETNQQFQPKSQTSTAQETSGFFLNCIQETVS
jgi:hypothetical protein